MVCSYHVNISTRRVPIAKHFKNITLPFNLTAAASLRLLGKDNLVRARYKTKTIQGSREHRQICFCMLPPLYYLLDADDVSHFGHDDFIEPAVRFQVGDVVDVKPHIPCGGDGVACVPDTGRARGTKHSSDTIDFL